MYLSVQDNQNVVSILATVLEKAGCILGYCDIRKKMEKLYRLDIGIA